MKTPTIKDLERSIQVMADEIMTYVKKHKKLIAILTIIYIVFNYLVEEDEE